MDLDVRHLRVVGAIAEHGSISKAAAALGYTQPALTAQLQRIERSVGGALFVRDGSGARPTALGTLVTSHSLAILASHEELMRDVRRRGPDDADLTAVRLGSVPGPLTATLMTAVRELLPEAEVSLHVNESEEELLELLAEGRLEFGLGTDYPGYDLPLRADLSHAVLAVEPVFVLLAQSHPLAGQEEVPLEELAGEQWFTGEGKDQRMRRQFRDACRRAGFIPRRVQRMNSAVIFPLIGQGHAVSLAHALTPERANVVARPLSGDPMWVRQRLVWPSWSPLAGHASQLRDALTAAYQSLACKSPVYSAWLSRRGG
ncbi:LysR family transcriptional regulator [Phytohabitans rumicis]|uniref:LysR family transcriptional regulator n=1 Tax=Phytohabitans rumicis TaxID=1076125 RepID=A0A6V8KXR0_9ACTN|nr:LysR family transcriptional regulator [Phytohabitans rumicis]GFJ86616.1 LysR family transcriptional regulator [Phytohabitans rumicis]